MRLHGLPDMHKNHCTHLQLFVFSLVDHVIHMYDHYKTNSSKYNKEIFWSKANLNNKANDEAGFELRSNRCHVADGRTARASLKGSETRGETARRPSGRLLKLESSSMHLD